ncbi:ETEC_3214 domain-containing protein [Alloalcanivorax profundimaris]|uniref:ETEC_3214 domain-containing protein n=1 Tax=Alloalcanivorax profundimaris TaxID=2735259 RepID=UPI00188894D1|nr:ETEC_3214 domain-containing protein [Alloalcanivorax profundimaris]MBF1802738.1 hypothetical protein [Alloalcanivorax profundimaris]
MSIESSIEWMKKHPVILVLSLIVVVLSSFITVIEGGAKIHDMYKSTIGHNAEIDKKLNSLNVEVDIGYFDGILGPPAIKNKRNLTRKYYSIESLMDESKNPKELEEKISYNEYFYVDELYFVQAVTDEDNKVGMYSITSRSSTYIPEIKTDLGDIIFLGKSTYNETKKKPRKVAGLLGMNLKHFNYYEVFLFDPGNYRYAIYSSNPNGYFDSVGGLDWEIGDVFAKGFSVDDDDFPMHGKHDEFRKSTTINTYSVTTPWFRGIDLSDEGVNYGGAQINFGPHVDQVGMVK